MPRSSPKRSPARSPRRSPRRSPARSPRRSLARSTNAKQQKQERVPAAEWLALSPAECRAAVMRHTMHAWKAGTLPARSHKQAVGIGLSKARTVCDSPRRLTQQQAAAFKRDPSTNPRTGRAIDPRGFTAQVLRALAAPALAKAVTPKSPPRTKRLPRKSKSPVRNGQPRRDGRATR